MSSWTRTPSFSTSELAGTRYLMLERFIQQYPAIGAAASDQWSRRGVWDFFIFFFLSTATCCAPWWRIMGWELTSKKWSLLFHWVNNFRISIWFLNTETVFFPKQTCLANRWGIQKSRGVCWTHTWAVHITPLCLNWEEFHLWPNLTQTDLFHSARWRLSVCVLFIEDNSLFLYLKNIRNRNNEKIAHRSKN